MDANGPGEKILGDDFLLSFIQGNLMCCNDGFRHREEALYKDDMPQRYNARKPIEIHKLNFESIKKLIDNFETLSNNDSFSKLILNTAELIGCYGTLKNLVDNMDQLQVKCQEVTEVINNVLD
jgi:hypothetical protein